MHRPWGLAVFVAGAVGAYIFVLRPRLLTWGASDEEVALSAPGDDLVPDPHLVATRAVSVNAPASAIWPWLVQIGRGRAGWYSYDRLDNAGLPSADQILPKHQRMEAGDVVPMRYTNGKPYGPCVLELEEPQYMLWGDAGDPPRFTWLWLLREEPTGTTRLVSRIRCRLSWRDPVFALLMEFADPFMMRKTLRNVAARAARSSQGRGST